LISLDDAASDYDSLSHTVQILSEPHRNAATALAEGYLLMRAALRKAVKEKS
jgi:hypothetical protein